MCSRFLFLLTKCRRSLVSYFQYKCIKDSWLYNLIPIEDAVIKKNTGADELYNLPVAIQVPMCIYRNAIHFKSLCIHTIIASTHLEAHVFAHARIRTCTRMYTSRFVSHVRLPIIVKDKRLDDSGTHTELIDTHFPSRTSLTRQMVRWFVSRYTRFEL